MGIKVSTDLFQATMSRLISDLEGVIIYLDDIIIIWVGIYEEHIKMVDKVLRRLEYKGLQVNMLKTLQIQA